MTTCVIFRWGWRVSAAVWLAGCSLGAAALSPETVALVESFSGRIAVLPGLPHEDWTTAPAGAVLVASGLRTHLRALTPEQFADTNFFNAQRFPVALYLGGEPYLHTVRRAGDGEEALRHHLAGGGTLLVLPCGPFPFFYNQAGQVVNTAGRFGLNIGAHGFETPPGALTFHVNTQQTIARFPRAAWPFPAAHEADQRWRAISGSSTEAVSYTPLIMLRDTGGRSLGDGAAWIKHRQGPWAGAEVMCVWFSLLANSETRSVLLNSGLQQALGSKPPPPATLACLRTPRALVMDGRLDEPAWQDAPASAPFKPCGPAAKPATRRTTLQARWDHHALYLACRCEQTTGEGKTAPDILHFFLAKAGHEAATLRFTLDVTNGLRLDSLPPQAISSNTMRHATSKTKQGWTAEMAVPWVLLATNVEPQFEQEWRVQVARTSTAPSDKGAGAEVWSPTDRPERTERFGALRLAADPLSDDFEHRREVAGGGTGWRLQSGTWKLDGGTLVGQDCPGEAYETKGAAFGSAAWRDYTLTVRFKIESRGSDWRDGPWFGLHCRPDGDGYYLTFTDRDCQLHKVVYGLSTTVANSLAQSPWKPDNQWHTLAVTIEANRIKAALDQQPLLEAKDDSALYLPSLRSGAVVLAARKASVSQGSTVVRFDDLVVTPHPPQHSFSEAPEPLAGPTVAEPAKAGDSPAAVETARLFRELAQSLDPAKATALAQKGEVAAPWLRQGLEQGGRLAALCAWALAQHPVPGLDAPLRRLLRQVDQVAGYWAARALAQRPGPENVRALTALLPDERLGFWELSANGAGRITDVFGRGGRQWAAAEDWMPNLRVAYAAMESLGELGGNDAAGALLRGLDNDQYLIRYGAARGLGRLAQKSGTSLSLPPQNADRNGARSLLEQAAQKLAELASHDSVLLVRLGARQALGAPGASGSVGKRNILQTSPAWSAQDADWQEAPPTLPPAIAFIKTPHRSESNLGFRDSYFFPKTPRYHSGENLYTLTPPRPDGVLKNLTQLTKGEVQGPEVSFDGTRILFAMRKDRERDGFHLFEINADGTGLRQITDGNCNDVDPCYLPDGRIAFCSDRAGYQEYYHQERSRVICVCQADGSGVEQITFNPNQDYEPLVLGDGRLIYGSYRFYAQDGSEGPLRGEWMGLARIETVLRGANPDGSADQLFYGSMRGSFYAPLRPMPFSDQWAGWHKRGYHVGVSISQPRELPGGRIVCTSPAGLTLLEPARLPTDCEAPLYPEVVNLAGGEEVYIHNYDEMNPVGRFTSPHPVDQSWLLVAHAPWADLRVNGYGLYLMNVATRELQLVYDDPKMAEVDPLPLMPRPRPAARESTLARNRATGLIYCNSVFYSDLPYDRKAVKYVRVLEGVLMGQSIAANAAFRTRALGVTPIHPDGSFYVEVPADVPVRFELLDEDGQMLVHETEFNYVRPGETKGCMGCHEPRKAASANHRPLAMSEPPVKALRQRGDLIYMGKPNRPYNAIHRD